MAGYLVTALCPYCNPRYPDPDCLECQGTAEVEVEVATRELAPPPSAPERARWETDASLSD
jgi:hypothetical protein